MKFTLSWLKEHLETDASAGEIAARLTAIGLEVESLTDPGAGLAGFIVGEVITAEKHPNADKLRLCSVSDGKDKLQIVCGAPNARAGIKVVLARPGTVIPATGEALKLGTIRGVESRGMMCSARELLLGEDHDGIIELKPGSRAGEPVVAALVEAGLLADDPLFDVSITPNRGDAASVFGIARDLAASGLGRLKSERIAPVQGKFHSPKTIALNFSPENKNACPIFAGRLIRGVKNGPAPRWVQERLKSVGMKSISALVDATNLIAQDRGRPLHVFDADKLSGNLQARMAKDGEQLAALDEQTYVLDSGTIVIADDARATSIAGIMGGMDSGSFESTTNVFIESAFFDPARIARAGRKLGIISDARYRFERGVDPQFVLPGLELCTKLILEWCGGEASDVVIGGELPPPHKPILFDAAFVEIEARFRHLLFRAGRGDSPELASYADLVLNFETYQAAIGGKPLDLTYMEYELLKFFLTHPGKVFTREQLLSRVWGYEYYGGARTVDVHVRRLRAKLGEEHANLIQTVRSVGYRFGQTRWPGSAGNQNQDADA